MKNTTYLTVLFILSGLLSCNNKQEILSNLTVHVIPQPMEEIVKEGSFMLKSSAKVFYSDETLLDVSSFLVEKIETSKDLS